MFLMSRKTIPTLNQSFFVAYASFIFSHCLPSTSAASIPTQENNSAYFSADIFSFCWRETFEAAFIASMMIQAISRAYATEPARITQDQKKQLQRHLWQAIAAALVSSATVGATLVLAFDKVKEDGLSDKVLSTIEGIVKIVLAILVNNFGVELLKVLSPVRDDKRFDTIIHRAAVEKNSWKRCYQLGKLPFLSTFMESLEAIVLIALGSYSISATAISAPAGVLLGLALVGSLHFAENKIPRDPFRHSGNLLLQFISAGMLSYGIHEFIETYATDENVWYARPIYDLSTCCSDEDNEFFKILNTLFGYTQDPSVFETIGWGLMLAVGTARSLLVLRDEKNILKAQQEIKSQENTNGSDHASMVA